MPGVRTVGYGGMFCQTLTTFPLSYQEEPLYVSTLLPTLDRVDDTFLVYTGNPL